MIVGWILCIASSFARILLFKIGPPFCIALSVFTDKLTGTNNQLIDIANKLIRRIVLIKIYFRHVLVSK